ncbi:MAG TPA: hypothetical protein VKA14_04125, partial [Gammaproteobacteria bacterium]|nr:hypothetical protein [Gammaproteobacteria bacterium]
MLRSLSRLLWYTVASLVVAVAVLVSLARVFFPVLGGYRADLEHWVSRQLGEPVTIAALDATWRGVHPVLKLKGIRLLDRDTGRVLVRAHELRIAVDLWRSVQDATVYPAGISLVGARLGFVHLPGGRITLDGLQHHPIRKVPLALILAQNRVTLVDSTVGWRDLSRPGSAPLVFRQVKIELENAGARHRLRGHLQLPPALGDQLTFGADLHGRADRPEGWRGTVYGNGQALQLASVLGHHTPAGLQLGGVAAVRCWVRMDQSRLRDVTAVVSGEQLQMAAPGQGVPPFHAAGLQGRFHWHRLQGGWRLDADR